MGDIYQGACNVLFLDQDDSYKLYSFCDNSLGFTLWHVIFWVLTTFQIKTLLSLQMGDSKKLFNYLKVFPSFM